MIRKAADGLAWRWQRNVLPYTGGTAPSDLESFLAPTVAIHQDMRSGGNLLIRLFDGHPALNVRPYNFLIGRASSGPVPKEWPTETAPDGPTGAELWREVVYDPRFHYFRRYGYVTKWGRNRNRRPLYIDLDCRAYYASLAKLVSGKPTTDQIITATHAGYFASWRNNANRAGPKKWNVIHYAAGDYDASCGNFLATMKGGKIITILREPESQIASLYKLGSLRLPFDALVERQRAYLERVCRFSESAPEDRYRLVAFERLVTQPEAVMRELADFLSIPFRQTMLAPTLNCDGGFEANTAFPDEVSTNGVNAGVANRKAALTEAQCAQIERATAKSYRVLMQRAHG